MKLTPPATRLLLAVAVLALCFSSVAMVETETETQSQTTGTVSETSGSFRFSMVPTPPGVSGYPPGGGSAEVQAQGTLLSVHFEAEGMARSTHLALFLMANGTPHSVTNMTTSYEGEVEAEATVSLLPGSYSLGLIVLDTSSFSSPTLVLVSSPATVTLSLPEGTQPAASAANAETQPVTTVSGGETEGEGIKSAIQTGVIPAVVEVGESGSSANVNDGNFSVSVGRYQQDGYLVSISGVNVTGPRVVLINLTSSQARALFSGSVLITLDGSAVQQAAFPQVLGAKAGDPPRFVLVSNPTALSLLVSIPHFSYHTIGIIPILAQSAASLLVYLPAVFFGVAAVTAMIVATYSRRTRADV